MRVCPSDSGQAELSDLPLIRFVMAMGEPTFAQRALEFVNTKLVADHISLFTLDSALVPHFLDAASRVNSGTALLAGRLYERLKLYRHDSNARLINACSGDEDVVIYRQSAGDIRDPIYRDRLYRHFNLLERVSLIRAVNGEWFVFNVYRDMQSGAFGPRDLDVIADVAALLVTCAAKHVALTNNGINKDRGSQSSPYLETLLLSIEPRLTHRERQVCSLALKGQTIDRISATLGIQQSTVATLRRRAYSKLGITKLNGLFALCIDKISRQIGG